MTAEFIFVIIHYIIFKFLLLIVGCDCDMWRLMLLPGESESIGVWSTRF